MAHLHDVERSLRDQGFLLDRVRGSHRHYRDPAGRRVTLTHRTRKGGLCWRSMARDAEVAWRVEAMRPQIPPRGPIPFLLARLEVTTPYAPGHCGSCGDPLDAGQRFRCSPCQQAAWQALNEVREGVPA
jgi:predicted RNA binding protein YcfA (HicA-like mRNA interferase family)